MSKRIKEGFTDEASRAEQDHEVQMARSDLYKLAEYSIKLHELLKNVSEQEGLQGWVQSKITKASDYIGSVYRHMEYKQQRQQAGGIPVAETKRTKMPAKRLKESTEVAELGRTMMDMATTEKDDDVS